MYELIYDFSDDYVDEYNICEVFYGTWTELQECIKQMRQNGCYNISATYIEGSEDYEVE